jgi:hypothetical protein
MGMFQFVTGLLGFNTLPKANLHINTRKNNINAKKNVNTYRNNIKYINKNRTNNGRINVVVRKNNSRTNNTKLEIAGTPQPLNKPINVRVNVPKNNHTKINMRGVNNRKNINAQNNYNQYY